MNRLFLSSINQKQRTARSATQNSNRQREPLDAARVTPRMRWAAREEQRGVVIGDRRLKCIPVALHAAYSFLFLPAKELTGERDRNSSNYRSIRHLFRSSGLLIASSLVMTADRCSTRTSLKAQIIDCFCQDL